MSPRVQKGRLVVKAEPGTRKREPCEQGRNEKKQEQGNKDTQVTPGLKTAFVDKTQLTSAGTP